ncbi:MAG: exodeoxyribonuclease VII small subunit [Tissierellia bacterium]|nr:exodeoxyribonuclease VII small subunit [Tissierellia bacterium]
MNLSYEEAFTEMEQIVKDMENDSINLDEMLKKYKRATELYNYLKKYLNEFEKEVKEVTEDGLANFDEEAIELDEIIEEENLD